jgi:class 3 adenylate cyclase
MTELARLCDAFLPRELLARIHGAHGDRPAAVEFPAAVLFGDVSRYTAMVERLAQRGQGGLEKIAGRLSESFDRCAEHVFQHGGELLYFAGDSLLAYWPTTADNPGVSVQAAARCAKAICLGSGAHRATGESDPVLHIGVGVGTVWVAAVGSAPVWNLIAGGDALVQAAMSQTLAAPGEYALSEAATAALAHSGTREHENAKPDYPILLNEAWLADFLPLQLRETTIAPTQAIDSALGMFEEIRPISALFARISGLDARSPSLAKLQRLCVSLQQNVRVRGGPPGEMRFDDKGLIFSVAFGARGSFHRDDPCRAIEAARDIQQTIQRLGLSTSVGVATGEALFCVVGSRRRRQLMVHGAAVNRAVRMMAAVTADVVCDAPTERASRSTYRFEQQGSLQLDGLGDMGAIFRPLERLASLPVPQTLIGRQRELAILKHALEESQTGDSRLLVVLGEPGIGKTALVTAFMDELQRIGTPISVARAEREDRRTSLLPWRRVLATMLRLPPDCDGPVVLEKITASVQEDSDMLRRLPLLDGVLGIAIPENEATRHLQGAHRGDATMRLMGDLVAILAPRPLVLVLEDSQWLDSASWRLVEWTLGSVSKLLLIACVRVEEVPDELKILRRRAEAARLSVGASDTDDPARFCQILDLEELGEAHIREVIARTLGEVPAHQELASRIAGLAGGNPFFAEEVSISLKNEGLIAIRDGFWRPIRPLDNLRYFESVERVIRERVDLLDTAPFSVLKAAAVIGRSFSLEALRIVLSGDLDHDAILPAIEALKAVRLVGRGADPGEYEFRHDQIRDVVYSLTSVEARRRFHGLLADWMEAKQSGPVGPDIAALVQHFEAAGNSEKAVRYAELAAAKALEVGAFREVDAFLGICFTHETHQQAPSAHQRLQAVRWRRQLAESHYGRGDIHAQGVAVRRALNVAGRPVPRSATATLVSLVGRAAWLTAQQVVPPTLKWKRPDRRPWERELARCFNQAATVDYFELRYSRGMCNLIGAVIHAERIGSSVELAVASAQLGCGLAFLGWGRGCDYFIGRAERVAIELADPAVHSHVCNLDALWRIGRCDWPMVDQRLNQSQDFCLMAGDQLGWCNAQGMRFWSLYYRGEQSVLEQTALALLSRAQNAGNIQQEIWALRCKALCVLHTDRPREAVDILRFIASAMLGSVDLAAQISAKGALALALARVGRHAESIETAIETLQLLRELRRPTSHSTLVGISGVTEVLLRGREAGLSREYDQWPSWERQALNELNRYRRVFPLGNAQYGLWTGVAHWLDGQRDRALLAWNEALANARRFALRQDESMIAAEMRRRTKAG